MVDIVAPEYVEVVVGADGEVWVNIDGACQLRVGRCRAVTVVDDRPKKASVLVTNPQKESGQ
jgi:hypothetical protein